MGNIHTSYIRIYKIDKSEFTPKEVAEKSNVIIKVHDEFGSYNVPIIVENNTRYNYLDIQFGSGKGCSLIDFIENNSEQYVIWHRIHNDSGGVDSIERVYPDEYEIPTYDSRNCKYVFDQILINNLDVEVNRSIVKWEKTTNGWKTNSIGYYFSENGQFLFGGKVIPASEKYKLKRTCDIFEWCSEPYVSKLLKSASKQLDTEIEFYYKGRLTAKFLWQKSECFFNPEEIINGQEFIGNASDDWDNCVDEEFLNFHNAHVAKVNTDYLITQITKIYDIEEAASALVDLSHIDSEKATELSYAILIKKEIDKYFEATAMMILYNTNMYKAIAYVTENYRSMEPYILGQFISSLTTDSIVFKTDEDVIAIAKLLKEFIKEEGKEYFVENQKVIDWFLESYSFIT